MEREDNQEGTDLAVVRKNIVTPGQNRDKSDKDEFSAGGNISRIGNCLAVAILALTPACKKETPPEDPPEDPQVSVPASQENLLERYDYAGDFHDGVARVRKGEKYFHIGKDGKPLYAERYDDVGDFYDGAARVREKGGEWFHIGKDGKPLDAERYDYVEDFHDGAARVRKGGKYFHIGKDGKPLYAERYDYAWDFYDGVARVSKGGEEFYIGKDGNRKP